MLSSYLELQWTLKTEKMGQWNTVPSTLCWLWLSYLLWFSVDCELAKPPNVFMLSVDDMNDWISILRTRHVNASTPNLEKYGVSTV